MLKEPHCSNCTSAALPFKRPPFKPHSEQLCRLLAKPWCHDGAPSANQTPSAMAVCSNAAAHMTPPNRARQERPQILTGAHACLHDKGSGGETMCEPNISSHQIGALAKREASGRLPYPCFDGQGQGTAIDGRDAHAGRNWPCTTERPHSGPRWRPYISSSVPYLAHSAPACPTRIVAHSHSHIPLTTKHGPTAPRYLGPSAPPLCPEKGTN